MIRDLDDILDNLEKQRNLMASRCQDSHAGCLREAWAIVRGVRNRLLADKYDATRKVKGAQ